MGAVGGPVPWVLDQVMLDRAYPGLRLDQALAQLGVPYAVGSWHPQHGLSLPALSWPPQPYVAYGSKQFCAALQAQPGLGAGLFYGLSDRMQYLTYTSEWPQLPWLNQPVVATSWAQLRAHPQYWRGLFGGAGLFVRPNSGNKTFAGQVLQWAQWQEECRGLDAGSSVMADTTVIVAPLRQILGEFRFVVAGGRVVTGSEYRWDGKMDVRRDWPPQCYALAQQVAAGVGWQPDTAYVVDVAHTAEGPRIIELNSLCCAGLYGCCTLAVATAVGALALQETVGDPTTAVPLEG